MGAALDKAIAYPENEKLVTQAFRLLDKNESGSLDSEELIVLRDEMARYLRAHECWSLAEIDTKEANARLNSILEDRLVLTLNDFRSFLQAEKRRRMHLESSGWQFIQRDVLELVLKDFDEYELTHCAAVCVHWRRVATCDRLWTKILHKKHVHLEKPIVVNAHDEFFREQLEDLITESQYALTEVNGFTYENDSRNVRFGGFPGDIAGSALKAMLDFPKSYGSEKRYMKVNASMNLTNGWKITETSTWNYRFKRGYKMEFKLVSVSQRYHRALFDVVGSGRDVKYSKFEVSIINTSEILQNVWDAVVYQKMLPEWAHGTTALVGQ